MTTVTPWTVVLYALAIGGVPAMSRTDQSLCQNENVTFSNFFDVSIVHISTEQNSGDCEYTINFSNCSDPNTEVEGHEISTTNATTTIKIESVDMFYRNDVLVTLNDNCDSCSEVFYVPDLKTTEYRLITSNYTGPIIDDLSNEYGCNFGSPIIEYNLCIHSGGSTDCFAHPCGNGKVYTSYCNQSSPSEETISLKVNGVENGTIISIYCLGFDCREYWTNVLLFNIGVILACEGCNENSECIAGQCVCKEDYIGDGIYCEKSTEDCEAKCTDNAECIQGQCVYKENSTVDGMRCERPKVSTAGLGFLSLVIPTRSVPSSSHSIFPTSYFENMTNTSQGYPYHQNHHYIIVVGVSLAGALVVFILALIFGIAVAIYGQHKRKGVKRKKQNPVYEEVVGGVTENPVLNRNPAYRNPKRLEDNPAYISTNIA